MHILIPIKISFKNLMAAKFRSFLTILGIIIGVASVIIIFAVGQSAQELILDQIRGVGSNLIGVLPGASDEKGPPASAMGIVITTLKYDDFLELKKPKNVTGVVAGAAYVMGTATVENDGTELGMSFTGITSEYPEVESTGMSKGRFFIEEEETNLSRVAVLGVTAAKDIFGDIDPIGRKIKINDYKFTVVGVLKERSSSAFGIGSQDEAVFVPILTAQKLLLGINHLAYVRLKIDTIENIPIAEEDAAVVLRNQHDIDDPDDDDFSIMDQASAVEIVGTVTNAMRYFLLAVGTISLVVGGVGVMNVMLIAVSQRIKEVGLRKAVGAKNIDVMTQFLVESATISFMGGLVGIIFGVAVSFGASLIITAMGYNWKFIIAPSSIVIAVSVSILIGIIFGIYPARKASKISPMEALRYE
ncbi:MAG: ABC transporter permease [Candidatus Moranbacteria bacterium]|jgi:putative ABC transport system permease protein|nr:ABC transporter permease [Candidatus Moranbacteria bacterium]